MSWRECTACGARFVSAECPICTVLRPVTEPIAPAPRDERRIALRDALDTLRSPLRLLSKRSREDILARAREHKLTVEDLIEYAADRARRT